MAIIKPSALISDIRGKIGGSVFQNSKAGLTLRSFITPVNRRTERNLKTRNLTSRLQQAWVNLTDLQRDTWAAFTTLNPQKQNNISGLNINGHQTFLKQNYYRFEYGFPLLSDPEFTTCQITPVDLTLRLAGPNLFIDADRDLDTDFEFIIFFITILVRSSINNPGSRFKLVIFTTTDADSFKITDEYFALFGTGLLPGNTVFFKFTNADKFSGILFPFKTKKITL